MQLVGGCAGLAGVGLETLTMVRHGESVGNAAYFAAVDAGAEEVGSGTRDPDTPLSLLGRAQAVEVGERLAELPESADVVLCSPYLRARETAEIALGAMGTARARYDERLRDRDTGILYGLTGLGVRRRHPEVYRERERLGRFYYRPPGGESWTDVGLRLRTLLPELDGHVLVFAHDVVIVMTRYILGGLDEQTILEIESSQLPNASISRWERGESGMELVGYGETAHLTL
ncbi:histidine phosphatase family protein [Nocardia sp. NPDC051030]|uniref:histidine phosphatase family protein n=1 Tax=Nocardia sp. NPDC051030 TaxID=3155162 RepID=UPI00343E2156